MCERTLPSLHVLLLVEEGSIVSGRDLVIVVVTSFRGYMGASKSPFIKNLESNMIFSFIFFSNFTCS